MYQTKSKLTHVSTPHVSKAFGKGVKLVLCILHYLQMIRVKTPFCSTVTSTSMILTWFRELYNGHTDIDIREDLVCT